MRLLPALSLIAILSACADPAPVDPAPAGPAAAAESRPAEADVPQAVARTFEAAYPSASGVEWSREAGGYEASFEEGGTERSVVYASDGSLRAVETEIAVADLPAAVVATLARDYPGETVREAARIVEGDRTTYEAEIRTGADSQDLLFSADGVLLEAVDPYADARSATDDG